MLSQIHDLVTGFPPGRLARWRGLALEIVDRSDALRDLAGEELQKRGVDLRWQAKSGVDLRRLMPDAFALIREAARRTIGMAHYPVQIMGAIAIFEGGLAEM